jgi:murein DD-endopeptidase MepM/ murein hydrolase activator NlpD
MLQSCFSLAFLFVLQLCWSQSYPTDYFRSPLDIPLQLSGNFGELRSNHFHAGFDFRTQQKEGFNIYAAAEGYVSRIKISTYGYGKAVYVTHPNGFTTVYGHLRSGAGAVERYIKEQHYKIEAFEIEVFPKPEELPVRKGQIIAISGNTGGSEGPHLHFEIRDTKTEKVINPHYFGFNILLPDNKRPSITSVIAYPMDENSVVNQQAVPLALSLTPQGDGNYLSEKVNASGRIGFGVGSYDMDSNSANRNGVFSGESFLNGASVFKFKFDTFHFDETRYLNAFIDFPRFKRTSQRVKKLFMQTRFPLSIIQTDDSNGVLDILPNFAGTYRIELADFNGNKTTVNIPLEYSPATASTPPAVTKTPFYIDPSKDYNFEKDGYTVFIPAGTFYDPLYLDFNVADGKLYLNNKNVAVHNFITITYTTQDVAEPELEKSFLATFSGTKAGYSPTTRKGNVLQTKVKALGTYGVAKDTIAPTIKINKPIEGKWLSAQSTLEATIGDNLSGIKEYKGYLNGKWILFEYDYKARRLTHNFSDGVAADGRNDLKIVVTDHLGNSAIFETHFFRSKTK